MIESPAPPVWCDYILGNDAGIVLIIYPIDFGIHSVIAF